MQRVKHIITKATDGPRRIITKATDTPRKRYIGLIVLLVLGGLVAGGWFYWDANKKSIIKNELDKSIQKKTHGLYTLEYEKFELDEVAGSLVVTNVRLAYDSVILDSFERASNAPSILVNAFIPRLAVSGVQTPQALIDKEIVGERLELFDPVIQLIYTNKGKDSVRHVPTKEVYRSLLGGLNMIRISKIDIQRAQLSTRNINNDDTALNVKNITIGLTDLRIDSTSNADSNRLLFAQAINLTAENIEWTNKKKLYRYEIRNVALNSVDRNITIGKFIMDPLLGEDAFMRRVKTQIDRFDVSFDSIRLRNVDFTHLMDESIEADTLLLHKANVKVYKDHGQPRDKVNRIGTFPHQSLQKLPVTIDIRKAFISNTFVEYKQNTPKSGKKGVVQFYNVNAAINNLTNKKESIKANNICRVDTRAMFMNTAALKATFYLNLASKTGAYTIDGSLGAFNAEKVNTISEPLAAAKIEKGTIKSLKMKLTGNDYSGKATVTVLYDDLKVAVLEKDEEEKGKLGKKKFASFAANVIIKNANPGRDGKVRTETGTFKRDTNRSFFNLVWKSLFVAIGQSLGAPVRNTPKD
ncbi:MAG: hypothetical protein H7Y31_03470 [Chitinophagaceae bacterium]|nr:hypothetical protein [Chitinophagaceae bacterium]